ncbi:hypothetical protein CNEO4_690016 [Clostridium neonatale]|nr:hypothetical protein CNEO4_690016 [Clostridium neonatale]
MVNDIIKFTIATGYDFIINPYTVNNIAPDKLINLSLTISFINIDIPINMEARYPTYSIHATLFINTPLLYLLSLVCDFKMILS